MRDVAVADWLPGHVTWLLAGHGAPCRLHFPRLLHQSTQRAEHVHQAVVAERALDTLGLPDLLPDLGPKVDADAAEGGEEAVEEAGLAHGLCVLAGSHARRQVRHDADAAVVEAAAQLVGPLT